MESEEDAYEEWLQAGCPKPQWRNNRSLIPGITEPGMGGEVAWIDGSTGFRHGSRGCGFAYIFNHSYYAEPIALCGANQAEKRALTALISAVRVKPLEVFTDSTHVQKYYKSVVGKDVCVTWLKRCSTPEMRLVDLLAKMAACTKTAFHGCYTDADAKVKELEHILDRAYDYHYDKSGPGSVPKENVHG
jgi:hypothetical protein